MFEKRKSQKVLLSAILPGESMVGQCDGFDLSLGHPIPALVCVSNQRVLWHWIKPPPPAERLAASREVQTVEFGRVHRLAVDRERAPSPLQAVIVLTQRDPEYGQLLGAASELDNPLGETDAVFGMPSGSEADEVIRTILNKANELSPAWRAFAEGIKRLQVAQRSSVSGWTRCPVCTKIDLERSAHAAYCPSCSLCFTDPDFQPSVTEDVSGVHFRGDAGLSTIVPRGRSHIWRFRPADMLVGPPFVPDPLEDRLMDADPMRIHDDGFLMVPPAHFTTY